jgi:hypothetical protein
VPIHFLVSGPSPEELGPLLHSSGERKFGEVNPEEKDLCAGGCRPHSTNRVITDKKVTSKQWHLLHAMRAMQITSQDTPTDSVESGDVQLGGEPPGKGEDNNFGVSRYIKLYAQIFYKSRSHLKILGTRMLT